ncbi:chaperonin family protein RbcX [Geitlerinema sp. PCC 7407]|nr:chaperonin family protein RbcX [Geitlerinema sp. PCC 7407]
MGVTVNQLMDLKSLAKQTAKVTISYLTYQAVRVIVNQLNETDPPRGHWLSSFSSTGKLQDGEAYLQELLQANQELAFRVMTVRQHLAEEIAEFLPEMVQSGIQQANVEYRRQYLERITQMTLPDSPEPEAQPGSEPD